MERTVQTWGMRTFGIPTLFAFLTLMSASARAETPGVFPVYDGHLILPISCLADDDLAWSEAFAENIAGLGPGDEVQLLHDNGDIGSGKLGSVTCLRGECHDNYAALTIVAHGVSQRIVAVAAPSRIKSAAPLEATETPLSCQGLPPQGADPHGFGFPPTTQLCTTHRLHSDNRDITILLAGQGWMQENGWPIYRFYYRVDGADADPQAWIELDEGTAALTPSFAWNESGGAIRLLWTRHEGIAGPPAITFREQSIEPDGSDRWISIYRAGGQSCD